ncbi:MAG: outer membrane protein assembly factor BamA [Flavobacterium sp.]|jgi:outer membrane protein assembly factor BamA
MTSVSILAQENAHGAAQDEIVNISCLESYIPAPSNYPFREKATDLPKVSGTINNIYVRRLKIFDEERPEENNALYRFANQVHKLTGETYVRQELLFTEGDQYNDKTIEESARNLRELDHLIDASIRIVGNCDKKIDVEVVTKDLWSLGLDLSFGRAGGETTSRLGISESNLLGMGKKISITSKKNSERDSSRFTYRDNNILGSRYRALARIENNEDGSHQAVHFLLPFYALDSRQSWGFRLEKFDQIDTQYRRGEDVSEIRHEIQDFNFFVGKSAGIIDNVVKRWLLGFRYRNDNFEAGDELPEPSHDPRDTTLSYPYLAFESIENRYTTATNLEQIYRTEDIHLGYTFRSSIGYSHKDIGADQSRLVFNSSYSDTLIFDEENYLIHTASLSGLWNLEEGASEDVLFLYKINYIRRQKNKRAFVAQFSAAISDNLNSNQQLSLGGESGLRGFNRRYQSGDKRINLTLEERQYTDYQIFNLAYLGFAAFIDIGRAWQNGIQETPDKLLANIGFGIRLASTKADGGRVIHLDLAYPLTNRDDPLLDSLQVYVTIKNTL